MPPSQPWRYLPLLNASGKVQMAIDRWLLQQHRQLKQPSTLRFYTWSPPAISLGYHQHRYPQNWHQLTWEGQPVEIVRRPTGGRAVLHQNDLTYMIVSSGISGRVLDVYHYLSQFLIEGWRSLGIELHYGQSSKEYIHNPNCLATSTPADLVNSQGQKLIGSALCKQGNYYLLHGSIKLCRDTQLYTQVFPSSPAQQPVEELSNLEINTIVDALFQAATRCFNIELISQSLSEEEWEEIQASRFDLD